ncbi:MAG: histidine phosphatase family protein [Desulfomonile sp.]|jgi:phosphohistidine phosphatase SixA
MFAWQAWMRLGRIITIFMVWSLWFVVTVQAIPAQVMIIRHAEKYEDRGKIHLNPRGLTRAKALAQFFQTDPRVLEYGLPAAIIAQIPSKKKKSVRCEETVEPLVQAMAQNVINRFAYGEVAELADWLRAGREWDSRSVLICAQHLDIVPLAKALGVPNVRQVVWPHETYDRVWLIEFSPKNGTVTSFRDIPQSLLFGDSFQDTSSLEQYGTLSFSQTYREISDGSATGEVPKTTWRCRATAEVRGDFSRFDDDTIPMLRLGGFTFGYYATTLRKLRQHKDAEVKTDAAAGSGMVQYKYKAAVDGVEQTYAWVSLTWDKEVFKAEFQADVDETILTPDLNMPVEFHLERSEGTITGVTSCYVAFGDKRFHAPAGVSYRGAATRSKDATNKNVYDVAVGEENGVLVEKRYLPEK